MEFTGLSAESGARCVQILSQRRRFLSRRTAFFHALPLLRSPLVVWVKTPFLRGDFFFKRSGEQGTQFISIESVISAETIKSVTQKLK